MSFRHLHILLAAAVLFAGCTGEDLPDEEVQSTENSDDAPGLEGMPEDGQGTIYF